jgi:hypothetical protein
MADTSQITLDVIQAIQQKKTVSFKYGGHEPIRVIKPQGFYGDFAGFEGTEQTVKIHIEPIVFTFHPTWSEVKHRLQELIDFEDLEYGVEIEE